MTYYRVLHIGTYGAIQAFDVIECATDASAIARTRATIDAWSVELWDQGRQVAAFDRDGDPVEIAPYSPAALPADL